MHIHSSTIRFLFTPSFPSSLTVHFPGLNPLPSSVLHSLISSTFSVVLLSSFLLIHHVYITHHVTSRSRYRKRTLCVAHFPSSSRLASSFLTSFTLCAPLQLDAMCVRIHPSIFPLIHLLFPFLTSRTLPFTFSFAQFFIPSPFPFPFSSSPPSSSIRCTLLIAMRHNKPI